MEGDDQVQSVQPPVHDAKWRFFWKIGERPKEIEDSIPQTIPKEFPEWEHVGASPRRGASDGAVSKERLPY